MTFTTTAGPVALLKYAAAPSGTPAVGPGINWKLAIDAHDVDISNFQTGRTPAPTLEGTILTFTLVLDSAAKPFLTPGVDSGLVILAKLFVDATNFYSGTFLVSQVEPGVEGLENVVMYPVTAKISGALTRPIA